MDIRKSARESFGRSMWKRREHLFGPRTLVSRSFPGNYGGIKHGTSSPIANKCCKRHTAGAAVPKFFAFWCSEVSFYAVFTNRAITNLSHAQATDDAGQINATFFAIFRSSALSLVEFLPSACSRRSSLASGVTSPSRVFGQVTTHNFYEHFMAAIFWPALRLRTSRDRRRLRL